MKLAAIVVARGGSVRLPGKALLPFGDTTLLGNKVRQLLACPQVGAVHVNTDSQAIADAAVAEGALLINGADYDGDTRRMIADSCRQVMADVILWAHPTNPLVQPATYTRALNEYFYGLSDGFDSLLSVTPVHRHAWLNGRPINYDPWAERHALAAELPPLYFQDGAIFIQSRQRFLETRYFFGDRPKLFSVPADEGTDIDTPDDMARALSLWESLTTS